MTITDRFSRWWMPFLWGLLGLSLVFQIVTTIRMDWYSDGNTYFSIAHSLIQDHTLTLPWGIPGQVGGQTPAPSPYTPIYPAYLAFAFLIGGVSPVTAKIAHLVLALATIMVTYLIGRSFFNRETALIGALLVGLSDSLLFYGGWGFGDHMVVLGVMLFVATTMKALGDPRWVALMGPAGAFFLLTKGTIVTPALFLIWAIPWTILLLIAHGHKLVKSVSTWLGIALFLLPLSIWYLRLRRIAAEIDPSSSSPPFSWDWLLIIHFKLAFTILIVGTVVYFLWPRLVRGNRPGLDLTNVFLLIFAGIHILGIFALTTKGTFGIGFSAETIWRVNHERYFVPFLIPLAWVLLNWDIPTTGLFSQGKSLTRAGIAAIGLILIAIPAQLAIGFRYALTAAFGSLVPLFRSPRFHVFLMLIPMILLSLDSTTRTVVDPDAAAVSRIIGNLTAEDVVAINPIRNQYSLYQLFHEVGVRVEIYRPGMEYQAILSRWSLSLPDYDLVGTEYFDNEFGIIVATRDQAIEVLREYIGRPVIHAEQVPGLWIYQRNLTV